MAEEKNNVVVEDDDFDLFDFSQPITEKKPVVKEKKTEEQSKKIASKVDKVDVTKKYKYPFTLHYAGRNIDVDHIFVEGQEYSAIEITKAMLEHQFYEFSGNVTYDYIKDDNVLVPIFQQHKKG